MSCFVSGCLLTGEPLGHGYSRSREYILFEGKRIDREGRHDIDEFADAVGHPLKLCSAVDSASFVVLNEDYTKDKNRVYYKWISPGRFWIVELVGADPTTFESLDSDLARDSNHVWRTDTIMEGADAATATVVRPHWVWKDRNRVYYQSTLIPNADPETFQHLGSGYYRDKNMVLWCTTPIDDADMATFKVLGDSFLAKDKDNVYRSGYPFSEIDAATCRLHLHCTYGYQVFSDKNGVYVNGLKFLHADPTTFGIIDDLKGKGGKYVFLVDRWHCTPVTVYKEGGELITETVFYEKRTGKPLATVKAKVSGDTLKDISLSPAPSNSTALPVPDWQIDVLKRPALVERMQAAGELL
ncbi:MAG: DKNYY domain-containing protein [Verrucomicrobiota bacterium]